MMTAIMGVTVVRLGGGWRAQQRRLRRRASRVRAARPPGTVPSALHSLVMPPGSTCLIRAGPVTVLLGVDAAAGLGLVTGIAKGLSADVKIVGSLTLDPRMPRSSPRWITRRTWSHRGPGDGESGHCSTSAPRSAHATPSRPSWARSLPRTASPWSSRRHHRRPRFGFRRRRSQHNARGTVAQRATRRTNRLSDDQVKGGVTRSATAAFRG